MATQDPTTFYNWDLPTVAGSSGTWGTTLNSILGDDVTGIDTVVKAVSDVANGALPKAGGVMTGRADILTSTDKLTALGSVSGAQALNLALSNVFSLTVGGALTLSVTNTPSGTWLSGILLIITNGGSAAITWPATTTWAGGAAPSLTAAGVDVVALFTINDGTTWRGALVGADFS